MKLCTFYSTCALSLKGQECMLEVFWKYYWYNYILFIKVKLTPQVIQIGCTYMSAQYLTMQ